MKRTFMMSGGVFLHGTSTEVDIAVEAEVAVGEPMIIHKEYGTPTEIEIDAVYVDGMGADGAASSCYLWRRNRSDAMRANGSMWLMSDKDVEQLEEKLYEIVGKR
jgi:hypothetical protein